MGGMGRCMGLNKWAQNLVRDKWVREYTEVVTRTYPDGRKETLEPREVRESLVRREESGELYLGMSDDWDEYSLHKYTFPDGRVYFERVQATKWSSGPVFFLALQDENRNWVPESLWTEEAIVAA